MDALERHSVGELPADERAHIEAHVATCARCQAAVAQIEVDHRDLMKRVSPIALFVALEQRHFAERRQRVKRAGAWASGLVAVAAVLLVWLRPEGAGLQLRGGGLSVYVKRGAVVSFLGPDRGVRPGDALRLVVTLDHRTFVRAWSIDDNGRVDALMSSAREIGPGATEIEGSVVVESPCVPAFVVVSVGAAASRDAADTSDRAALLERLSKGGYAQRVTCDSR